MTRRYFTMSCLALGAMAFGGTAIADDEAVIHERVHEIVRSCDGEDCDDSTFVFRSGDGGPVILGEGPFEWATAQGDSPVFVHHLQVGGTFLGVQLTELTSELRTHFGVPEGAGVMVSKVTDDSPAWRSGIQVGDIITRVAGETVASGGRLAQAIRSREAGESVDIEIWRDGQVDVVSASLAEREGVDRAATMDRMMHFSRQGGPGQRRIIVRGEQGKDCGHASIGHATDCGGDDQCRVEVRCEDGDCDCTVNAEAVDCATLGVPQE